MVLCGQTFSVGCQEEPRASLELDPTTAGAMRSHQVRATQRKVVPALATGIFSRSHRYRPRSLVTCQQNVELQSAQLPPLFDGGHGIFDTHSDKACVPEDI